MGRSHLCSFLWNVQIIRWITSSLRHIAVLRNITVVSYKFWWILYCWLGNNIIWYWIFFGHHRMAYIRNDIGGLWLYCALQVNWALPVLLLFCDLINYSPLFISVCFFFCSCSGFWPTLAVFLQKIPVLGWIFQQPYIRSVCWFCNLVLFH